MEYLVKEVDCNRQKKRLFHVISINRNSESIRENRRRRVELLVEIEL